MPRLYLSALNKHPSLVNPEHLHVKHCRHKVGANQPTQIPLQDRPAPPTPMSALRRPVINDQIAHHGLRQFAARQDAAKFSQSNDTHAHTVCLYSTNQIGVNAKASGHGAPGPRRPGPRPHSPKAAPHALDQHGHVI